MQFKALFITGFSLALALLLYFVSEDFIQYETEPIIENVVALPSQKQTQERFGLPTRSKLPDLVVNTPVSIDSSPIVERVVVLPEREQAGERESSGLSMRLKIPSIKVDAYVQSVGLTPDGEMDVPKSPSDLAWFKFGPQPGEIGSAVISGHYGWKNNIPAVFDNLYKLQTGDKIYVENDKGEIVIFMVRESRSYNESADASYVFSSNDGRAHLNLVTCEGVWNKDSKSYSKRLVVFTDRVM